MSCCVVVVCRIVGGKIIEPSHFRIRTISLKWTHHHCLMQWWYLDTSSLSGFDNGIVIWAAWISCWKCYYCLHLMQHLVRAILIHCTTSKATWRCIHIAPLHLILLCRIMMLDGLSSRDGKSPMKLLMNRYLRMHLSHMCSQWKWLVLMMHLMPPIRSLADPILGFSFCSFMCPWCDTTWIFGGQTV